MAGRHAPEVTVVVSVVMSVPPLGHRRERTVSDDYLCAQRGLRNRHRSLRRHMHDLGSIDDAGVSEVDDLASAQLEPPPRRSRPNVTDCCRRVQSRVDRQLPERSF